MSGTRGWLAGLLLVWAGSAHSQTTPVRVGEHAGFGRLVFDLPADAGYDMAASGDRVLLVFHGAGTVLQPAKVPRNVISVGTGQETATIVLATGAVARPARLGSHLVIDILNPPRSTDAALSGTGGGAGRRSVTRGAEGRSDASGPAIPRGEHARGEPEPAPSTAEGTHATPVEATGAEPPVTEANLVPDRPAAVAEPVATAPVIPVEREPLTPPVAVAQVSPPVSPEPSVAAVLRVDADVGAAAFERDGYGYVVLDRRVTMPQPPAGGVWLAGTVSMTLRLPLPPRSALRLTRAQAGWTVQIVDAPLTATLAPAMGADGMALPMGRPGHVVAVADPRSGGTLLIGTSLAAGPEMALQSGWRTPDYALVPTWLGVVVEPLADRVDLRATQKGFVLTGGSHVLAPVGLADTRRFDFPDLPGPALLNRLRAQLAGAAAAPVRGRSRERVAAAQTMIALGMGAEAQALLQLVTSDDPQAAADAEVIGLNAVAALVAGRPAESEGLDDARLDGSDEIRLWRGLRDGQLARDSVNARAVGGFTRLASTYPASLRRLVWPMVAEAAVEMGMPLPDDQLPAFARALTLERSGAVEDALKAYGSISAGQDRLDQVRATARAAELRLSAGMLKPADVATILERQAFAWRGDAREAALRLRAAELRGAAGEWRVAFDALRGIDAMFPEQHAAVQARKTAVLQAMLSADGGGLSPLELVLLAAEYADGVPEGEQGGALARMLAEKLMALDLPARAIPIMQGLMKAAPAGEARAEFGGRLAQLLLDGGDPAGARTALETSAAAGLSAPLTEVRGLVLARVRASQGDVAGAAAGLFELGTEAADDLRATMLGNVGDWRGSLGALSDLAAKRVPSEGPLSVAAQEVLLREASAAAQVPDPVMLRMLEQSASRMTGPRADLLRVLTAAPLAGATDLPRAARELRMARALPQQLQALGAR